MDHIVRLDSRQEAALHWYPGLVSISFDDTHPAAA